MNLLADRRVQTLRILMAVSAYVAVLLWAYVTIISPVFAYQGMKVMWPDAGASVGLLAMILSPAVLLPYSLQRFSSAFLWLLYLAAYVPVMIIPELSLSMEPSQLFPLQLAVLLCMLFLCMVPSLPLLSLSHRVLKPKLFWSILFLMWMVCIVVSCVMARGDLLVANLAALFSGGTEYDIRREYREALGGQGFIVGYVVGQLCQAVNPYLIAYGIIYRKRVFLLAGILGQVIVFGITGLKGVIFSIVFLPLLAIAVRSCKRHIGLCVTLGVTAGILLFALVDSVRGNIFYSSMFTRRMLVDPGLLTGFYFEHYSKVPLAGIAYRFVGNGNVYGPPNEIGLVYFGSSYTSANANLWAEGFADFGVPGILGLTLLLAFMIWIYDTVSKRCDPSFAALMAVMPALGFANTAPTTQLISHGGLLIALLLYLTPSELTEPQVIEEEQAEESSFITATAI